MTFATRQLQSRILLAASIVLIIIISPDLKSQSIYKCRGPSGKVEYSDIPCQGKEEALSRGSVSSLDHSGLREQSNKPIPRDEGRDRNIKASKEDPVKRSSVSPEEKERQVRILEKQMKGFQECSDRMLVMVKKGAPGGDAMANLCASHLPRPPARSSSARPNVTADYCVSDVGCPDGTKCVKVGGASMGVCHKVEKSPGVPDYSIKAGGTHVMRCSSSSQCDIGYMCESLDGNPYNSTCVRR